MIRLLFAFILFQFASQGLAAAQAPSYYMMIYNYHGSANFRSAKLSSFGLGDRGFQQLQIGALTTETAQTQTCKSLLEYSQNFSLSLMQAIDYISDEQKRFQKNVENQVVTDQIKFTEISALEESGPSLNSEDGQHASVRLKGRVLPKVLEANSRHYRERKKTAMWLIGGQTLKLPTASSVSVHLRFHNLAWQNDPAFSDSAREVNREKYKFIWELGRSGQVQGQRLIIQNMTALILAAYKERRQLEKATGPGGAYVFAHALDESHTKLFKRLYGGEVFATDKNDKGNNILIMSLDDILARYPIAKLSQKVRNLVELSEGKLSDLQAIDLLDTLTESALTQLDLFKGASRVSSSPLVIENYSLAVFQALLKRKLNELQLSRELTSKIYFYLANKLPSGYQPSFANADFTPLNDPWKSIGALNGIVISNLDSDLALKNQGYIYEVLLATRAYYEGILQNMREAGAQPLFKNGQLSIVMRTTEKKLADRLVSLGGKLEKKYPAQGQFNIIFDADKIGSLAPSGAYDLKAGYWYHHGILSQPLEF